MRIQAGGAGSLPVYSTSAGVGHKGGWNSLHGWKTGIRDGHWPPDLHCNLKSLTMREGGGVLDSQQPGGESGIQKVELGGLDEPLVEIAVVRWKQPDQPAGLCRGPVTTVTGKLAASRRSRGSDARVTWQQPCTEPIVDPRTGRSRGRMSLRPEEACLAGCLDGEDPNSGRRRLGEQFLEDIGSRSFGNVPSCGSQGWGGSRTLAPTRQQVPDQICNALLVAADPGHEAQFPRGGKLLVVKDPDAAGAEWADVDASSRFEAE